MERRAIAIRGIVQGVGFRPFVHELAARLELAGFVRNQSGSVVIEVEGESKSLDRFVTELTREPPPLAHIDELVCEPRRVLGDERFRIDRSAVDRTEPVFVAPDVATCDECLEELFDPRDRRFGYPFINCTQCGPRLSIVIGAPYDRVRTTMSTFVMCDACRAEYEDPANRRFHAEPVCCPTCGPRLNLVDRCGQAIHGDEPVEQFAASIRAGAIGALKGLGGYHLVCDAGSDAAVSELRRRKHRDEKPFALMVADVEAAQSLCELSAAEEELLRSRRRPIVLLRKRPSRVVSEHVAPNNRWLGIMLPYTPLHYLLVRATGGVPLVMTSGNRSDEPITYEDHDAVSRLSEIADLFLVHDRPIRVRCDDSVTRIVSGQELPVRRSRGYAPLPIRIPVACPFPILAVGGQLKCTFALGRGRHAFVSHHLGDLDHLDAYRAFVDDIDLYERLFEIEPSGIAHDLHPDCGSTRYAVARATRLGLPTFAVQHHHAHLASCMAEHGFDEPVIGVTFDGTGFGADGAIWGGEFLLGDFRSFRRAAHLRYVGMPGGDQAIREPWRMALAHLHDAECDAPSLTSRVAGAARRTIERMLEKQLNSPPTSSMGRLFDAVASLAYGRDRVTYEAQAAMELEWLATGEAHDESYPFEIHEAGDDSSESRAIQIDARPLIRSVARDVGRGVRGGRIARRFHSSVVEFTAAVCDRLRRATGLNVVVLSGGVFMNALLTTEVYERLIRGAFRVYRHRLVPPNDGGLSLGQLAVAAAACGAPYTIADHGRAGRGEPDVSRRAR